MRRRPFTHKGRLGVVVGLLVLSACTTNTSPIPLRTRSRPPAPGASATGTPTAHPAGLDACPAAEGFTSLPVLARGLGGPDDLLALADGTVWVSDPVHGTLSHLSASGATLQTIVDPETPEGLALLPDGRLAVAEQARNRVVALRLPSTSRTTLFELPSAGAAAGLDGIAFDRTRGALLVPDSPHGTLLTWSFPGGPLRTIARGLGRGVDAADGPQGSIYVTVEAAAGLLKIVGGRGEPVGRVVQADDVVYANGLLYVTLIGSGQLVAIDAQTGARRVLVTGISAAQGLTLLPDGRLAIADSNRGEIARAKACA